MNEERTGKSLRQVEQHIHGHLWHRYSITVNQVMVADLRILILVSSLINWGLNRQKYIRNNGNAVNVDEMNKAINGMINISNNEKRNMYSDA
jgi:hypothetical protein